MIRIFFITLLLITFLSCTNQEPQSTEKLEHGKLEFAVNGEDFVNNGFQEKNGWNITFDKVLINLSHITARLKGNSNKINLDKEYFVNLKNTGNNIKIIETKSNVEVGEYRELQWQMSRKKDGDYTGYSFILIGQAVKDDQKISFEIKLNEEVTWFCKDGYAGEELKGFVDKNKTGQVEMTFHLDHIFGDFNQSKNDPINKNAVGFDYFAKLANSNILKIDQNSLKEKTNKNDYHKFIRALQGIGHSGEQHTEIKNTSTKLDI